MYQAGGPTFPELLRQAMSSTDRGYDLLAPKFDLTPFRTPDMILERCAQKVALHGSVGTGLDLCCGTGAAMAAFGKLCSDKIVGLDRSAGMLAQARENLASIDALPAFVLEQGDALSTPFDDASFDLITCFGAFGHILPQDEARFVAEVGRLLRPGGRFVFVTSRRPPFFSAGHLLARTFNGVMRLRNMLFRPEFIMYYLTFLWPDVAPLFRAEGLKVEIEQDAFDPPFGGAILVTVTRCISTASASTASSSTASSST